ncbi:MAG: type II toxin-antitoxin system VapC family toxin [Thermoleophilia bacterium]
MTVYVDSSVLLRFVLGQPDTLEPRLEGEERVASRLVETECLRGIAALLHRGELGDEEAAERRVAVHAYVRRLRRVSVSDAVLRRAGDASPLPLKTLDAIHIATALLWRDYRDPELVFATHDHQQARVALALGFEVIGV